MSKKQAFLFDLQICRILSHLWLLAYHAILLVNFVKCIAKKKKALSIEDRAFF